MLLTGFLNKLKIGFCYFTFKDIWNKLLFLLLINYIKFATDFKKSRKIVKVLKNKKIAIVSDHAGYYLKEKILKYLIKEKYDVKDFGCSSPES